MTVVLDLPYIICIWISAAVAIVYTLLGGLYSVAYTDVIQLVLMFISMVNHKPLCTTYDVVNHLCWSPVAVSLAEKSLPIALPGASQGIHRSSLSWLSLVCEGASSKLGMLETCLGDIPTRCPSHLGLGR